MAYDSKFLEYGERGQAKAATDTFTLLVNGYHLQAESPLLIIVRYLTARTTRRLATSEQSISMLR